MEFPQPVRLRLQDGETIVKSVAGAQTILTERWPVAPGPRHRDAIETCLKVLDGHRSTIDAQNAIIEAAAEAKILIEPPDAEAGTVPNDRGAVQRT